MTGGKMADGTPWVAIEPDDPEAEQFIVHTECEKCGKVHHFDFWTMMRGEPVTCEHCGNVTRAKVRRYISNPETGELEEVPPRCPE